MFQFFYCLTILQLYYGMESIFFCTYCRERTMVNCTKIIWIARYLDLFWGCCHFVSTYYYYYSMSKLSWHDRKCGKQGMHFVKNRSNLVMWTNCNWRASKSNYVFISRCLFNVRLLCCSSWNRHQQTALINQVSRKKTNQERRNNGTNLKAIQRYSGVTVAVTKSIFFSAVA